MTKHWTILSSETVDLTPEVARAFSTIPSSTTERELSTKRVKFIESAVLGGRAIIFDWAKATIKDTGETVRLNGQHSGHLMAGFTNENFPRDLKVHLSHYEVDSKESAALLFRQIDSRKSSRSPADIAGVYQGLEPALIDVPRKAGMASIEGICWFSGKIVGDRVPQGDDKYDLFTNEGYHPFIQMVGRIFTVKTPEFTTPVMGSVYGSYLRDATAAEEFWVSVSKGGDETDGDPATTLDSWLVNAKGAKENTPQFEIYRACVVAWNAFRQDKNLDRITKFIPGKGIPELE